MIDFQKLLSEQSSVKVVLNGGHSVLEDATVPFMIGLDDKTAERQPTHVLVITLPHSSYETHYGSLDDAKRWCTQAGERQIFELNKIGYLQFHKPGKQNVIFVLIKDLNRERKGELLKKRSLCTHYSNEIHFSDVEANTITGVNVVGYCEELIEIPKEFFATKPEKGLRLEWHKWVNRWWLSSPIDECQFRKRAIIATTIQPIAWVLGFTLRFIFAMVCNVLYPTIILLAFLVGSQFGAKQFFINLGKLNWDFLFLFRKLRWSNVLAISDFFFQEDKWFEFKEYRMGKKSFGIPISPLGLTIQIISGIYLYLAFYSIIFLQRDFIGSFVQGSIAILVTLWHAFFVVSTMPYDGVDKWLDKTLGEKEKFKINRIWTIIGTMIFILGVTAFSIWMPWVKTGNAISSFVITYWKFIAVIAGVVLFFTFGKKVLKHYYKRTLVFLMFATVTYAILVIMTPSMLFKSNYSFSTKHWIVIITGLVFILISVFGSKLSYVMNSIAKKLSKMEIFKKQESKKLAPVQIKTTQYVSPSLGLDEWYKKNMAITDLPVNVNNLTPKDIVAPTKKAAFVLQFKVGYWRLKSKLCKPYAKS